MANLIQISNSKINNSEVKTVNARELPMGNLEIAGVCDKSLYDLLKSKRTEDAIAGKLNYSDTLIIGFCLVDKINSMYMDFHDRTFKAMGEDAELVKENLKNMEDLKTITRSLACWFEWCDVIHSALSTCWNQQLHLKEELLLLNFPVAQKNNLHPVNTYIVFNPKSKQIKIGKSKTPENRIRTLETQAGAEFEVLALIESDLELKLHKKFAEYRTVGEWFEDRDGVICEYAKTLN